MYFDEMIRKEMKTSEFSEMESTDEIIEKIRENTLNSLEEQADFMKEFPNPTYAVMRLDYLSKSEEQSHFEMLLDLYKEKKLTGHLMDIQKQAIEFMRTEKPKLMAAWKIEGENNPQYGAMISALKEMTIKEMVEI
ncbi:Uncharacterised protein [Clostridioides difficile]|nr:Uncharacterised protein [Clostridioides difficile]VIC54507.1 Uncharacterised protein [Clostridioides difficile]VIC56192.1 Uncharacterised protein [Clostridioides difficile]VIC64052.1 Uncharacterised protein [Clostridioides difficile]